jgi:hypothetical protein
MTSPQLQYIKDLKGKPIAVVLPIEYWNSIFPVNDTQYLNSSNKMKKRIIEAMNRNEGMSYEEVNEKFGI